MCDIKNLVESKTHSPDNINMFDCTREGEEVDEIFLSNSWR